MKKLLGIVVLGLLLSENAYAVTGTIYVEYIWILIIIFLIWFLLEVYQGTERYQKKNDPIGWLNAQYVKRTAEQERNIEEMDKQKKFSKRKRKKKNKKK